MESDEKAGGWLFGLEFGVRIRREGIGWCGETG